MKFLKLLTLIVIISSSVNAQKSISFEAHQDLQLLISGDKYRGYEPGTMNSLLRFTLQGNQDTYGYFTVSPQFEFANTPRPYKRYSVGAGYTLNKLIIPKSEISININWGWFNTDGIAAFSTSATLAYKFLFSPNVKIIALGQATEDYTGIKNINFSVFAGIEIDVFKIKKIR